MSCQIILKLGNEVHTFSSNEELDGWLFANKGRLSLKEKDVTYSLSPLANSAQKNAYGLLESDKNLYSALKSTNSSAVRTSWSYAQNYVGDDKEVELPAKKPYSGNRSEPEQKFRKTLGSDFDNAIEKILKTSKAKKYSTLRSDRIITQLEARAKEVIEWIKSEHGENCEIITHFGIGTTTIGASFLNAMRMAKGWNEGVYTNGFQSAGNDKINGFVGELDCIVIDGNGIVHIYDFKTSGGNVSVNSDPTYAKQIAIYRQLARQLGVKVGRVGLIPIKINYKGTFENSDAFVDSISPFNKDDVSLLEGHNAARLAEKWFPHTENIKFEDLSQLTDVMKEFIPNSGLDQQTQFKEATVEEEMKNIYRTKESNPHYQNGEIWQYTRLNPKPGEDTYLYAKTEEDMRKLLEKEVERINENKAGTYLDFAQSLKDAMQLHDYDRFDELAANFNRNDKKYIIYMFKRYVNGTGWKLISDELMISNGIFLFQNGDVLELVMLDTHNPYREYRFDHPKSVQKYTTIFGQFLSDADDNDNRWNLHCYYGNFLMMKGLTFLAQHPQLFNNCKLAKVATMNLTGSGFIEESNEKLVKNWERWSLLYQNKTGIDLGTFEIGKHVLSDNAAYVHIAMDLLRTSRENTNTNRKLLSQSAFRDMESKTVYSLREIEKMINAIRNAKGEQAYKAKTTDWDLDSRQALQYLNRAYLSLLGYQISPEARVGLWSGDGGINISGLEMRPFSKSASAIGRVLHEAYFSFIRVCQEDFVQYTSKWKLLIQKLYEESGYDKNWGGAWDFFDKFFEHDGNKLDQRFILKKPGTMLTKTENDVLDMFYEAIDKFKYGNNPDEIRRAQGNGTYWEVPLVKSRFRERSSKTNALKALLEQAKKDWNVMRDLLMDVDVNEDLLKNIDNLDETKIPAYILTSNPDRENKLKDNIDKYTTDLDFLFNLICQQGIKSMHSPGLLMITSAIRGGLSFMEWAGNKEIDNISKAADEYIQSKVFGRPIHDRKLDPIMSTINIIKKIVSTVVLGASLKAFTRETITGMYRGFEMVKFDPNLSSKIDFKMYVEAVKEVIEHCYENNDVMSLHMQLNQIYGTANFSYDQMAEASTITQLSIRDLETSDLFFTATWPDFIHRNAIIIAHLKTIGAYNAYKMDNGILKYDMDLDPRFELLRKYKTETEVPVGLIKQWRAVYQLYQDAYDSWKNNGYIKPDGSEFKFGDKLPQALSPREVAGLKQFADDMYGNYDEETKSLMTKKLLGSLFLQFKTYGINRLQMFFDGETDTSDIKRHPLKITKNGKTTNAYRRINKDNKLQGGDNPLLSIVPEDEVTLEEIKSGEASLLTGLTSSHRSGGYIKKMIDLGCTLFLYRNQEEFEKLWKENPTYKADLTMFMIDTFGMLLLALLINYMYNNVLEEDYEETEWYTKWAYNVAIGVTQDGPVWSVLSSVVGDGTPPLLSALQNWSNNAWSVITGKKNFLEGVASTFGATRELAYLFQNVH